MRTNKRTFPGAEIVPQSWLEPLDLQAIFGRVAPLEVDLGCGDGTFLVSLAQDNPERDFLGVERLPGRARSACRRIGDCGLTNVRILPHEIVPTIQQLLAPGSVDIFHLLFPDPWPKRRHWNRRVFSDPLLRSIARSLKPGGALRVVTDNSEYFAAMQLALLNAQVSLALDSDAESRHLPVSTFEERFRERGAKIHRLVLRKTSARR